MSILATDNKLISFGTDYSAGSGISIIDHTISVTGEFGKTYSAGPNINIYEQGGNNYISGKDWSSDIANASANAYEQAVSQIPEPQDLSYISATVDKNTSGIDYISSVCLTSHKDWTDTIKDASANSYTQSTSYFNDWINGQYNGDIANITNNITALSGDLSGYYKKTETSSKEQINDALQYVSANAGKVYEGISPIVVNNDSNKISADSWVLSAGNGILFTDNSANKVTRIDVTAQGGDEGVNSFVHNNSATILDVNSSYKANSGNFLTAIPSDVATTGDVANLEQTISDTYYPKSNPSSFVSEDWVTHNENVVVLNAGSSTLSSLSAAISANKEIVLNLYGRMYRYDSLLTQFGNQALFHKIDTSNDTYAGRTKQLNEFETVVVGIGNLTGVLSSNYTLNTISLIADWNESNSNLPSYIKNKPDLSNSAIWNEVSAKVDTTALIPTIDSNTISYSAKPTDNPIYASGNNLNNVNSIQGKSNLAIVPNGVLQVPNVITATNGVLQVPNAITATNGNLIVPNAITAVPNYTLDVPGIITSNQGGLTANGLSANTNNGLTANGLTADANHSGFSAIGISAGKQGPFIIQGLHEFISSNNKAGFIFSSDDTNFNSATLTTAGINNTVGMPSPKFEARNISGAGFSIEASGAKGYDASGNVVWDTYNPKVKNIISYSDTKTAQGGLNGNIILTVQPSTNASNLTNSPYVIMDAYQASYFASYGPSAQTPTLKLVPGTITVGYEAGNAKTTVGYNDIKQELSGSSWTLTGSIQKRELEYDASTSAITAIAGSAIGGGVTGEFVPQSAFNELKQSYDALSSLFATYSGQWLLPNEGV